MDDLVASVQYGDYVGSVAADRHDHHDLTALAKKFGVDTSKHWVYGIELYIGEIRGDEVSQPIVKLLLATGGSLNNVNAKIVNDSGTIRLSKHEIEVTLSDVLLSFKRFKIILKNSHVRPAEVVFEES